MLARQTTGLSRFELGFFPGVSNDHVDAWPTQPWKTSLHERNHTCQCCYCLPRRSENLPARPEDCARLDGTHRPDSQLYGNCSPNPQHSMRAVRCETTSCDTCPARFQQHLVESNGCSESPQRALTPGLLIPGRPITCRRLRPPPTQPIQALPRPSPADQRTAMAKAAFHSRHKSEAHMICDLAF